MFQFLKYLILTLRLSIECCNVPKALERNRAEEFAALYFLGLLSQ